MIDVSEIGGSDDDWLVPVSTATNDFVDYQEIGDVNRSLLVLQLDTILGQSRNATTTSIFPSPPPALGNMPDPRDLSG